MISLVEVVDRKLNFSRECLSLQPFKGLYGKGGKREQAIILYLHYMTSEEKSNPFKHLPFEEKKPIILRNINSGLDKPVTHTKVLQSAIDKIEDYKTKFSNKYQFYLATKKAFENLKKFLNTVDLQERTDRGTPVFKATDISRAIKESEELVKTLDRLEVLVIKELEVVSTAKTINYFSDPKTIIKR